MTYVGDEFISAKATGLGCKHVRVHRPVPFVGDMGAVFKVCDCVGMLCRFPRVCVHADL